MTSLTNNIHSTATTSSVVPPLAKPLPPRYRFRDLILGDYAYADDGER